MYRLITSLLLFCFTGVVHFIQGLDNDDPGYCSFPHFLWQSPDNADQVRREWTTETLYSGNSDMWTRKKSISVKEKRYSVRRMLHAYCNGSGVAGVASVDDRGEHRPTAKEKHTEEAGGCVRESLNYDVLCISEEAGDKYRVIKFMGGQTTFTCLKFREVGKGVVLVFSSVPSASNEERLCYDSIMQKQEWPWIDERSRSTIRCPFGDGLGMGVRFYSRTETRDTCRADWLPSTFEAACSISDRIHFSFNNSDCSPFKGNDKDIILTCSAVWIDDGFMFLLLRMSNASPRYVMRLTASEEQRRDSEVGVWRMNTRPSSRFESSSAPANPATADAYLYQAAVTSRSNSGHPPASVHYNRLKLSATITADGLCFDSSTQCTSFALEGKCDIQDHPDITRNCMMSCSFCNFAPSAVAGCHFGDELQGAWLRFPESEYNGNGVGLKRPTEVRVNRGELYPSRSVKLICKSKHWDRNYYKILQVSANGCKPSFSCMEIIQSDANFIKYRISESHAEDKSFDMCKFPERKTSPLYESYGLFTKLIPRNKFTYGDCGILRNTGKLVVNRVVVHYRAVAGVCHGRLHTPANCEHRPRDRLRIDFNGSCAGVKQENLVCIGYQPLNNKQEMFVTFESPTPTTRIYTCWTSTLIKKKHGFQQTLKSHSCNERNSKSSKSIKINYGKKTRSCTYPKSSQLDKHNNQKTGKDKRKKSSLNDNPLKPSSVILSDSTITAIPTHSDYDVNELFSVITKPSSTLAASSANPYDVIRARKSRDFVSSSSSKLTTWRAHTRASVFVYLFLLFMASSGFR